MIPILYDWLLRRVDASYSFLKNILSIASSSSYISRVCSIIVLELKTRAYGSEFRATTKTVYAIVNLLKLIIGLSVLLLLIILVSTLIERISYVS